MPAPVQEFIVEPTTKRIQINLEPAYNAVHSLLLLAKKEKLSGVGDWVNETILAMSEQEWLQNELVMIGFHFAVVPEESWPSLASYIEHLARLPPLALRDKLLDKYIHLPCLDDQQIVPVDKGVILSDVEAYLEFLRERFSPEYIDEDLESQAYSYIVDPPAMQELIVSHLQHMWDAYLADEWSKVKPMLTDAVMAFEQVDYSDLSNLEAAQFITGQTLNESHWKWEKVLEESDQIIFVPSAHVGPYIGRYMTGETITIIFGARLPEGSQIHAPDLSRAEILVRLNALADDTRLQILKLIADEGEKHSREIIDRLGLSQSAASRHLSQLAANGFLVTRRCEGAKCYKLNPDRIENTLHAVSTFLISS
jgi:DNA-binding transcriptional ArsR family regulator